MLKRQINRSSKREKGRIWSDIKDIENRFYPKEATRLIAHANKAVISGYVLKRFMDKRHLSSLEHYCSLTDNELDSVLLQWLGVKRKHHKRDQKKEKETDNFRRMFSLRTGDDDEREDEHEDGPVASIACSEDEAEKPKDLERNLQSNKMMDVKEEGHISNIFRLADKQRWNLYRLWRNRLEKECQEKIYQSQDQGYETALKKLRDIEEADNLEILRGANVIAMTTTCAAKYH